LAIKSSAYQPDWFELIKYYLATKVYLTVIMSISKISISLELFYISMTEIRITRKKRDLDLSVEWSQVLFRNSIES